MAGDFTLQYAEYHTYGTLHYQFMQMHHPVDQELNILFTDGHVDTTIIEEPPNHLASSHYQIVRPGSR